IRPPPPRSTLFPYTTLFRSNQTPVPSHNSTLMRLPARLQNTNAEPEHGECPSACCTIIDKPSMPRRISTGPATSQMRPGFTINRSEEHTSELQSRENLVCRL